ncbi:MAG: Amylo-alpha-1,6-glucosidase, partial [Chloroflexi bacterium]|nr:Amylo-alpha-1,6-glucosidase [Chloroflexota bacterium]
TEVGFDRLPDSVEAVSTTSSPQRTTPWNIGSGTGDPREELGMQPPLVQAVYHVDLLPRERWSLTVHIVPTLGEPLIAARQYPSLDESFTRILDEYNEWESSCTRIESDSELLNALIRQSVQDLRLVINRVPTGLLPVAGIPWFAVPFGRDSLITSLQTLALNPDIAYGTLRFLAMHQGRHLDTWRDEEPGKILHEIRSGEMAALGEVPQSPYYGSVDSTPLFVWLFSELMKWTDDWVMAADLKPHLEQALEWIRIYGDRDGDGLIEYESHSASGISNQGWKDSFDSIAFPDGRLAQSPVAVAEVQGYAYAAESGMAEIYEHWGDSDRAAALALSAAMRRKRFEDAFWMESEGFYAEALDGEKKQVRAVTTNPGHCFLTGLLQGPHADAAAERLMLDDMLCGWGLRTLSGNYPTFNPISYHNGSIWPHDNSMVAAGLSRAGYQDKAARVIGQVFDAGFRLPGYRLPELFCGFSRDLRYQSLPAQYPVSCAPQSWAAGSVIHMLQALIGLNPDLPRKRVELRPALLPWLNELRFQNLRLGPWQLSIRIWRAGEDVRCEVTGADGLDVVIR